jgi:hypothetical protein
MLAIPTQKYCVGIGFVLPRQGDVGQKCQHLAVGPTCCRHVGVFPSQDVCKIRDYCPRMKETSCSFCSFDLTWLLMVRLARDTTTIQPAFIFFYQNEDGNFCLCWCHRSLHLLCCCSGQCQSIVCIACTASVACMTCCASVTWLYFLVFFCNFFIACFDVVPNVLVAGDLRHE